MEDIFKKYTEVVEQSLNDMLKDYNLGKDDGPKVMYAKTPAAFAKFNEMIRNGKQVGPLISYNMSSVTIDKNQQNLCPIETITTIDVQYLSKILVFPQKGSKFAENTA